MSRPGARPARADVAQPGPGRRAGGMRRSVTTTSNDDASSVLTAAALPLTNSTSWPASRSSRAVSSAFLISSSTTSTRSRSSLRLVRNVITRSCRPTGLDVAPAAADCTSRRVRRGRGRPARLGVTNGSPIWRSVSPECPGPSGDRDLDAARRAPISRAASRRRACVERVEHQVQEHLFKLSLSSAPGRVADAPPRSNSHAPRLELALEQVDGGAERGRRVSGGAGAAGRIGRRASGRAKSR